jgi:integrase
MPPTKTIQRKIEKFGIIRFSKSSGTHNPTALRNIGKMVDELIADDEGNIVWALHRGRLSLQEAYGAYRKKGARGIREIFQNTALTIEALAAFADAQEWSEGTREDHFYNWKRLSVYVRNGERLADLPVVLARYRDALVKRASNEGKPVRGRRLFNYVRRTTLQWIGATQGKTSDTYQETASIKEFKAEKKPRRIYLSPSDVKSIISRMPENIAEMFWTMATTGSGPKEYVEDGMWLEDGGIRINGKKTKHRDRIVPLVYTPAPVCLKYEGLRSQLTSAIDGTAFQKKVSLYDFRRCYPRWLLSAGVEYPRVMQYQGHAEQTMTDTYLFSDTKAFLEADAKLLKTYIEEQLALQVNSDASPGPDVVSE